LRSSRENPNFIQTHKNRNIKKPGKMKKVGRGVLVLLVMGVIVAAGIWLGRRDSNVEPEEDVEVREPTVMILDENAGGHVSDRVKGLIMRLEGDLAGEGLQMARVVLPFAKTRQIDVYLEGRVEYYKVSIDRGSAVSAEDIGRMVRYLDERELKAAYVDIRVEGKAFFK